MSGAAAVPEPPGVPQAPPDRKETEVRRLLAADPRPVPPDLTARALAHGRRLVRLRRAVRLVCWTLLLAAAVTAAVLAVRLWPAAQPLPVPAP